MPDNMVSQIGTEADARSSTVTMQKWGGIASFLMAVTFIAPPLIYLMGDLRSALGPLTYDLADFLYGPVWAASLVTAVFALRERIGGSARHRMPLSLLAAVLAAGAMVTVACIRSANRHYHLMHPELNLQESTTVLVVWTTILAGLTAAGWHFLGWSFVLVGSAGWSTRRLPRLLSAFYLVIGVVSLFAYLQRDIDMSIAPLAMVASIWQGIVLWSAGSGETQAPGIDTSQPDRA